MALFVRAVFYTAAIAVIMLVLVGAFTGLGAQHAGYTWTFARAAWSIVGLISVAIGMMIFGFDVRGVEVEKLADENAKLTASLSYLLKMNRSLVEDKERAEKPQTEPEAA